jgi:uncharacterized SAM-binding protein YcdF (DUF218 family)
MTVSASEPPQRIRGWWRSTLARFYESLTCDDAVRPADLIFVMAGRMERKIYGLELYRAGIAPKLVLSVGRFEVSKMRKLNVEGLDELLRLREETALEERHFFVKVDSAGTRSERARLRHRNTFGEALALRRILEAESARRVIVVSTDVHLRRVALAMHKACETMGTEFRYCAVPPQLAFFSKETWWSSSTTRRFVTNEMAKWLAYRLILSLPEWAIRWIMRFRDDSKM